MMKIEPICTGLDPCCWYWNPDHVPEEEKRWSRQAESAITTTLTSKEKRRIRAGVFLYNRKEDKLLVVQAYNQYLGLPKGGKEKEDTTLVSTALRELREETGVILPEHLINPTHKITLYGTATYFIVETDTCYPLNVAGSLLPSNDVSGAGWIHIDCLSKVKGSVTSHLKQMLKRVLKR